MLDPIKGELIIFKKAADYASNKLKAAECFKLRQVVCAWGPSSRAEMRKLEIQASIELNLYDESILLLGAHEKDQVNKWLAYLQKAQKFVEWFLSIKGIVEG